MYSPGLYLASRSTDMNHSLIFANLATLFLARPAALHAAPSDGPGLEVTSVNVHDFTAPGEHVISGQVTNTGSTAIHGFVLHYAIDGGAPVQQSFGVDIAPGASYAYSFSTPWDATEGEHTVTVTGGTLTGDVVTPNNTITATTKAMGGLADRTVVIEEFTSSTCWPCADFNQTFDPTLSELGTNTYGSRVAAVKYQMNWPDPGNDPSYNAHGSARRNFYTVEGIPFPLLDGSNTTGTASVINARKDVPSPVLLDVSYTRDGNSITVTARVTPLTDLSGSYKLHLAVTEDHYHYTASATSQDDYHYVMRTMLPNAGGTSMAGLTAGEERVVTETVDLVPGGPAQGNFNLWGTVDGITVVAFLQKTIGKEIYQGAIASSPVGIEEAGTTGALGKLYPNPTDGWVLFQYAENADAHIEVVDLLGHTVLRTDRTLRTGQLNRLDLSALGNGLYVVNVTAANGVRSAGRVLLER